MIITCLRKNVPVTTLLRHIFQTSITKASFWKNSSVKERRSSWQLHQARQICTKQSHYILRLLASVASSCQLLPGLKFNKLCLFFLNFFTSAHFKTSERSRQDRREIFPNLLTICSEITFNLHANLGLS